MKQLIMFVFLLHVSSNFAQVCDIDYSQTVVGIYPDTLPQGTVGQAYDADVTFVMPLDTMGYDFTNFKILSLSLPVGLNWECNNSSNGCNYDPQVSQHGCVNVYGTPLLAGQYQVDVTVIADLTVASGYPFTFQVFLEILPNNVGTTNDGFSMNGSAGCNPITVEFTNNNPGLIYYTWDFGNGNTSNAENPNPQVYNSAGDYVVHYEAYDNLDIINVYTLIGVTVNSMSNYGEGFPGYDNADTYFVIKENGNTIYNSSVIGDQNPPVSWTVSIVMNDANTYTIEVFDADDSFGEVLFGADDYMGQHTMMLTGCNGCGTSGGDGPANISYTINHQVINPTPVVVSEDTVHVFGFPQTPIINYDTNTNILSTPDMGYAYQWYINGSPISWSTANEHPVYLSGVYQVIAVNSQGCVSFSDTITAIYCSPTYTPDIDLVSDSLLIVSNPQNGYVYQWYLDGSPLPNSNEDSLFVNLGGSYTVELTDSFGCQYISNSFNYALSLEDVNFENISIYPNPTKDILTIQLPGNLVQIPYVIRDNIGRIVYEGFIEKETVELNLEDFKPGVYIFMLKVDNITFHRKIQKI